MLYQLGGIQFSVYPLNTHEVERQASADFAAKDVIGALRPREAVGEGDNSIRLRGRLFPQKFGGLDGLAALDAMRVSQAPHILVRGDGRSYGWWVIEQISETSSQLDARGVGRVVEIDVSLVKAPGAPSAGSYIATLFGLLG